LTADFFDRILVRTMRWPFMLRRVHEAEVTSLRERLASAQDALREAAAREQAAMLKADRLTDAALIKAGHIHAPIMVEPKPRDVAKAAAAFAGMNLTEVPRRDVAEKVS
jgi:hypothetical protein